jgi:hypothetical protein
MTYLGMVELIRKIEPFSPCAIGQYEACDHLGHNLGMYDSITIRGDKTILIESKED